VCGDADGNGDVTVTDGVQALRAAAGLSTTCTTSICDLNVDGNVTITDGVLTLRRAAGLSADTSCLVAQAGAVLGRTRGILEIGIGAIPSTTAGAGVTAFATTMPCPDGGSTTDNGNGFTDVDCRNGDLISNGTVMFVDHPGTQDRDVSFENFSVQRISTGETLVSSSVGTLVFSFSQDGSTVRVNGTVSRTSNRLGTFADTFTDVTAQDAGGVVSLASGTVVTLVTAGGGGLTHITRLDTTILGPQLAIVIVTFLDSTRQVEIFADNIGLCDPCQTNSDCNAQLVCAACSADCRGTTHRCSINSQDVGAQCSDGLF
jgi:hypothetical protein